MHSATGGENSASSLEGAAKDKRKEYRTAYSSFSKIVKELREAGAPSAEGAATLCAIERLLHSLHFHPTGESRPSVVTFGVNYDGVFY